MDFVMSAGEESGEGEVAPPKKKLFRKNQRKLLPPHTETAMLVSLMTIDVNISVIVEHFKYVCFQLASD